MLTVRRILLNLLWTTVAVVLAAGAAAAAAQSQSGVDKPGGPLTTGFILVAPDRGFLGNEETRDAAAVLVQQRKAEVVFVTDERTRQALERALTKLARAGAREVVVIPLFVSANDPKLRLVQTLLGRGPEVGPQGSPENTAPPVPVRFAKPFGESYLAVEILADRLRTIESPAGKRLVVVGYGAADAQARRSMEADWQRLASLAARGFGFESVHSVVWFDLGRVQADLLREPAETLQLVARGAEHVVVVPFQFGRKLDSMMTFTATLRRSLPKGAHLVADDITPHPDVSTWMVREANRQLPADAEDIGVVFLAHGSDYHWNETMEQAVEPLAGRYKIEFAFSMADQPIVERAVRRLEQRGARAIVIVRVFGLTSSFEDSVERMIGMDIEGLNRPNAAADHSGDHGHNAQTESGSHGTGYGHTHGSSGLPPRIRSTAVMSTAGGLEAHPLFAAALLDRAKALSSDPQNETVILVAHGAGEDARNEDWLRNLEAMASMMRGNGGGKFRAIHFATWREDWPEKRESRVRNIRGMVEEAKQNNGRAIVIPARTTGQGPEQRFLSGLEYELGSGFAPHPLFAQWVEEQIRQGMAMLDIGEEPDAGLRR